MLKNFPRGPTRGKCGSKFIVGVWFHTPPRLSHVAFVRHPWPIVAPDILPDAHRSPWTHIPAPQTHRPGTDIPAPPSRLSPGPR